MHTLFSEAAEDLSLFLCKNPCFNTISGLGVILCRGNESSLAGQAFDVDVQGTDTLLFPNGH